MKRVVVGFDGSPESIRAVEFAAAAAKRRGAPLLVVNATGWERPSVVLRGDSRAVSADSAQQLAQQGADHVPAGVQVEALGINRGALAALVDFSHDAQLLVVGSRGRGRLRGTVLGSVAFGVASHAACDVAVVRGEHDDGPVTVGVDGSSESVHAAQTAAAIAARSGEDLTLLIAWRPRTGSMWDAAGQERATQIVATVEELIRQSHPDLQIRRSVLREQPEAALLEASKESGLVVLGARGLGDFASLLLGSVSRRVIAGAHCAVYVVR